MERIRLPCQVLCFKNLHVIGCCCNKSHKCTSYGHDFTILIPRVTIEQSCHTIFCHNMRRTRVSSSLMQLFQLGANFSQGGMFLYGDNFDQKDGRGCLTAPNHCKQRLLDPVAAAPAISWAAMPKMKAASLSHGLGVKITFRCPWFAGNHRKNKNEKDLTVHISPEK